MEWVLPPATKLLRSSDSEPRALPCHDRPHPIALSRPDLLRIESWTRGGNNIMLPAWTGHASRHLQVQ